MSSGIKRKRPQTIEKDDSNELSRKLCHDARLVRKVARKAKVFEMRKMLKKLKEARSRGTENEVTKDLEAQVDALKDIDSDKIANSALLTKIRKDKILSNDRQVQSAVATDLAMNLLMPGRVGTPVARVQSRLLSSKLLASEVSAVVETLRNISQHPSNTGASQETDSGVRRVTKREPSQGSHLSQSNLESDWVHFPGQKTGGTVNVDGWDSGTVSDNASSGSVLSGSHAEDRDDAVSDTDSDMSSVRPVPFKRKGQSASSKGQSEFLPSLSVGFARGSSDIEFSDSEAKAADGIKKNRRGQRARRAIWEKKFGKNANHVKKQREISQGWNSKRPRFDDASGRQRPERRKYEPLQSRTHLPDGHGHQLTHRQGHSLLRSSELGSQQILKGGLEKRNSFSIDSRKAKWNDKPFHPSWEAKKRERTASIVPSQGTKIVFT